MYMYMFFFTKALGLWGGVKITDPQAMKAEPTFSVLFEGNVMFSSLPYSSSAVEDIEVSEMF